jgi:hypothetical protein
LQLSGDERLRTPARKACEWLVRGQHADLGGWRYAPGVDSDTSVFGWCVLALASGRQAGFEIPAATFAGCRTWLGKATLGRRGGLACYQPGYPISAAMTAEALACRQALGAVDADAADEAVAYVLDRLPEARSPQVYYWYYATLALFHEGGPAWERWNARLQAALLPSQRQDGHAKGSWDPHEPFGVDGGRVFSTAACALCLEAYYRHLPLYNRAAASPR